MTKFLILVASLTLLFACNFAIDPRNASDEDDRENDEGGVPLERQITYTVTYKETAKTLSHIATLPSDLNAKFFAGHDLMPLTASSVSRHEEYEFSRNEVAPTDIVTTVLTYKSPNGDITSGFDIPRVTIEDLPARVSRSTGFVVTLGGEPIEKGDFVDLELYNPETKTTVAVFSLQPSIPGMESTVTVDGQSLTIASGFLEWFSEFESGKSYLLSINRSAGGWSAERALDYLVNYRVQYNSALKPITVVP